MVRLGYRLCVLGFVLVACVVNPSYFDAVREPRFFGGAVWLYLVWGVFLLEMFSLLFPQSLHSTGSRKQYRALYKCADDGYDREKLRAFVRQSNASAWGAALVWLLANGVVAALYLTGRMAAHWLFFVCAVYYVADLVCVLFWCPFQSLIMKNRCCVSCRIYNWDWFMICTPLLLIPGFFTWSLCGVALFLLVRWEVAVKRHPEYFWPGSNARLRCINCTDKMCRLKKPLI